MTMPIRKIIVTIVVVSGIFFLSSCKNHQHEYEWQIDKIPSCLETGSKIGVCVCGEKITEVIAAQGHEEIILPAKKVTCEEEGLTEGKKCASCNTILIEQEKIAPIGHKYNSGEIIKKATNNVEGIKKYSCQNRGCRHSYTENYSKQSYTVDELYEQYTEYVGQIITYNRKGEQLAIGSGIVITSNGQILTNYSLLDRAASATFILKDTEYEIFNVLKYDEKIDLVILKINAFGLSPATLSEEKVNVGDTVYNFNQSLENKYIEGTIVSENKTINDVSCIVHDINIVDNLGGIFVNIYGEVVGYNVSDVVVSIEETKNFKKTTSARISDLYLIKLRKAKDALRDFILVNGEYNDELKKTCLLIEEQDVSFHEYHVVDFRYDESSQMMFLSYYIYNTDKNYLVFSGIGLYRHTDMSYYELYIDNGEEILNQIYGFIDSAHFTIDSVLEYEEYKGDADQETLIVERASEMVDYIISKLELIAKTNLKLTLEDFGFLSFESRKPGGEV